MNFCRFRGTVCIFRHLRKNSRGVSSKQNMKDLAEKFDFDLDKSVYDAIKTGTVKTRHHPGKQEKGMVSLPERLVKASACILADHPSKTLLSDANKLANYIRSRHPPLEGEEYTKKVQTVEEDIVQKEFMRITLPGIPDQEMKRLMDSKKDKIENKLKREVYNWKPITYNEYRSLVYIVARMAPDYASLINILSEIKKRDKEFTPLTMLDFGSGVGTSMWAMDSNWPNRCKEVVCVDSSVDMNNIADKLLRGGNIKDEPLVRKGGTFFKQYLPMSDTLKYDLVISSRSLFELPDMISRLRTIDVLWRKTNGYLVIVEAGTNAGYKLVLEARDYILALSSKSEEDDINLHGHVFSPCSHDKFCPRYLDGKYIPCNFEVSYRPHTFHNNAKLQKDRYCYVVMRKGKRDVGENYPRMLQDAMLRKKHIICELCTKYGTIQTLTATKRKHSKECYDVLKYSRGGDLLPIVIPEWKQKINPSDREYSECDMVGNNRFSNEEKREEAN
ncbi:Methyltransferase-like protein 17, mitochondrial [Halocaridina rubra]|uniref:Methyltransferase-like protein 17, mitochondrial n=1 Tax=Halocaridina rubra TaxID=373956 RepID=A0AAN8X6F0_HALRR